MVKCVKKINILEAVQHDGYASGYNRVRKFVAHHAGTKYTVHPVRLHEINAVDKIDIVCIFNTTKLMQLHAFDWLVFNKDKQDFEIYDENEFAHCFCSVKEYVVVD